MLATAYGQRRLPTLIKAGLVITNITSRSLVERTSSFSMPLKLEPMVESDVDTWNSIMWSAFGPDLMACMYPNGFQAADRAIAARETIEKMHKPEYTFMKVIDTDLPQDHADGKIVGMARWQAFLKERSEEELDEELKEAMETPEEPNLNVPMMQTFIEDILKTRRQNMGGKPFFLLSILATHADHHRRGIGAMQMQWGCDKADELGLPAYLEASPKGKGLYERFGFEAVGNMEFDARKWGHKDEIKHVCMLRPAKKAA